MIQSGEQRNKHIGEVDHSKSESQVLARMNKKSSKPEQKNVSIVSLLFNYKMGIVSST